MQVEGEVGGDVLSGKGVDVAAGQIQLQAGRQLGVRAEHDLMVGIFLFLTQREEVLPFLPQSQIHFQIGVGGAQLPAWNGLPVDGQLGAVGAAPGQVVRPDRDEQRGVIRLRQPQLAGAQVVVDVVEEGEVEIDRCGRSDAVAGFGGEELFGDDAAASPVLDFGQRSAGDELLGWEYLYGV